VAISFVNGNQVYSASYVASLAVPPPASIADGDILVCTVLAAGGTLASINAPDANWTSIGGQWTTSPRHIETFWKRCSSESGDYTFTGTDLRLAAIVAFRGCKASGDPQNVAASNTAYNTSDTIIRAAGLTLTAASTLVWCGARYASYGITKNADFSLGAQAAGGSFEVEIDYRYNVASGGTGNIDGSFTNAVTNKAAQMLALEEPAAATGKPYYYLAQL